MIPVDQTKFAPKVWSRTEAGNCVAACFASIFEVDINSVPVAPYMYNEERKLWMASLGYEMTEDPLWANDWWQILVGLSPRTQIGQDGVEYNIYHAVVGQNGKTIHDPHFSRKGLLNITNTYWFRKIENENEKEKA